MNDRQRLEAIVSVVCKYLPPDGISKDQAMTEIISLVDPLPKQEQGEPVAHTAVFNCPNCKYPHRVFTHITGAAQSPWEVTTPQPKQEQSVSVGEPVGFYDAENKDLRREIPMGEDGDWWQPVYTTPQPKQSDSVEQSAQHVGEPVAIIEELIPNTDSELLAVRWLSVEASFKNPVGTLLVPFKNIKEN